MKNKDLNFILIICIFIIAIILSFIFKISLKNTLNNFNYNVIIILICMELFTDLICNTGIIEKISLNISKLSKGNIKKCAILFGSLMFIISTFLNNITAVLMILPIIFVLFKSVGIQKKVLNVFFAVILAMSNTGGASSPIGDFPAIIIMNSGITSFKGYLIRAFPLFLITSIILLIRWSFEIKEKNSNSKFNNLSVDFLMCRYKYIKVDVYSIISFCIILLLMMIAWIFVPTSIMPTELVALLGLTLALLYCLLKGMKISLHIDFKSILTIGSFMFMATIIAQTGYLEKIAILIQNNIENQKLLLITIMILTSFISGLFGAGPAATAMMPIIVYLCKTSFGNVADWIAVAYAAAICAGSSLFMWSATAGLILSKKIENETITDASSKKQVFWQVKDYFKYGLENYMIQITVAILVIYFVI